MYLQVVCMYVKGTDTVVRLYITLSGSGNLRWCKLCTGIDH